MTTKLNLSRVDLRGLASVVRMCHAACYGHDDAGSVVTGDLLCSMAVRLAQRTLTAKAKGNRVTLNGGETLAVWLVLKDIVRQLPPLEMAVGLEVLKEIERQSGEHVKLMRANLESGESMYLGPAAEHGCR